MSVKMFEMIRKGFGGTKEPDRKEHDEMTEEVNGVKRVGFVEVSTSEDTYREVTSRSSEDLSKRNGFWVSPDDFFDYGYMVFKDEAKSTVLGIHEIKRTWRFDRNYDDFLERMFGFSDGELDRRFEKSKWVSDSMGGGLKTAGDDELYVAEIGDKVKDVNSIFTEAEES